MEYIRTAKMADFSENFLSGNDFEDVLAIFFYYDYGSKASEAVEKIATGEKGYRKCSICVIQVGAKPHDIINNSKTGWLLSR